MEKQGGGDGAVLPFMQGWITGLFSIIVDYWLQALGYGVGLAQHRLTRKQIVYFHLYTERLPAALLVASTYTTSRIGSFENLKQILEAANHGRPISLYQEASCGMAAGAIGSIFFCPINLALHRIEANPNFKLGQQSHFRYLLQDLCHTAMDKGVLAIYRGGGLYTARTIALNTGMFASYGRSVNYFKESWGLNKSDSQFGAALVSGIFASACSLPFVNLAYDIRAVRNNDKFQCKSFFDCTIKSFEISGHTIFCKGFMPHFFRTAPLVMTTWIVYETILDKFQRNRELRDEFQRNRELHY